MNEQESASNYNDDECAVAPQNGRRYDPIMVVTLVEGRLSSNVPLTRHFKTELWARPKPNNITNSSEDEEVNVADTDKLALSAVAFELSNETLEKRPRNRNKMLSKDAPAMLHWLWNFYAHFAPNRVFRSEKNTIPHRKEKSISYNEIVLIVTNEQELLLLLAAVCTFVAFNSDNIENQLVNEELDPSTSPIDKAVSCVGEEPLRCSMEAVVRCNDSQQSIADVTTFFHFFLRFKMIQSWRVLYSRHVLPKPGPTAIDTDRLRDPSRSVTDNYVPKIPTGKPSEKATWLALSDNVKDAWAFTPCASGPRDQKGIRANRHASRSSELSPTKRIITAVMEFSYSSMQHDKHRYVFWFSKSAPSGEQQATCLSSSSEDGNSRNETSLSEEESPAECGTEETSSSLVHNRDDSLDCYDIAPAEQHHSSSQSSSSLNADSGALSAVDDSAAGMLHHLRHPSPPAHGVALAAAATTTTCVPESTTSSRVAMHGRAQNSAMDIDIPTVERDAAWYFEQHRVADLVVGDEEAEFCFSPPPSLVSYTSTYGFGAARHQRLLIGSFGRQ